LISPFRLIFKRISAALQAMTRTCMLDQQAADNPGGCPESAPGFGHSLFFLIDKTNVDIVNQSGGLRECQRPRHACAVWPPV